LRIETQDVQVFRHVARGLHVGFQPLRLRVGDKDHAIGALQHQFAAADVVGLPWYGVEVKARFEASDLSQFEL